MDRTVPSETEIVSYYAKYGVGERRTAIQAEIDSWKSLRRSHEKGRDELRCLVDKGFFTPTVSKAKMRFLLADAERRIDMDTRTITNLERVKARPN